MPLSASNAVAHSRSHCASHVTRSLTASMACAELGMTPRRRIVTSHAGITIDCQPGSAVAMRSVCAASRLRRPGVALASAARGDRAAGSPRDRPGRAAAPRSAPGGGAGGARPDACSSTRRSPAPASSPARPAMTRTHAFGPPNALPVQLGGGDMRQPGLRAVPSLRYLQAVPPFTEHFFDSEDEADESVDNGPTGGLTWDGRVDRGARPGAHPAAVAVRDGQRDARTRSSRRALRGRLCATTLRRDLRRRVFDDPRRGFDAVLEALEVVRAGLARPSIPTRASTTPSSPARRR